jgi:hypothetical protein
MANAARAATPTPAQAAYFAASMAPGFGATDAAGQAGRMPAANETLQQGLLADGTSMAENFEQGNYLDSGLQGLGLLGDAAYAIPAVGVGVAGALKAPRAIQQVAKIRAFHGSPYQFDEFSDKAIGSGEGAQAYGYGHYLAEREGTARSYRDSLSSRNPNPTYKGRGYDQLDGPEYRALAAIEQEMKFNKNLTAAQAKDQAVTSLQLFKRRATENIDPERRATVLNEYDEDIDFLRGMDANEVVIGGSMYEVDIDADPSELLDYDKPLSQQAPDLQRRVNKAIKASSSPLVKKETDELYQGLLAEGFEPPMVDGKPVDRFGNEALAEITGNLRMSRDAEVTRINTEMNKQVRIMAQYETPGSYRKYSDPKGEAAAQKYDALMDERAKLPQKFDQRAAQLLKEAGVKGIKYADAQTRFSPGEKTSNYVIFDPRLIEISKRYGVPITVAATMLAQMDEQQPRGLL